VYLQLGNGVTTSYTYRLDNRRLDALQAQLPNVTHYRFQNLAYGYDKVGNILGIANSSLYPEGQKGIGEEVGGPVTQSYVYDDLYRLTQANGEYRHNANDLRRYRMSMGYDSIHNILAKEQLDEEIEQEDGKTETEVEHKTSYTYGYHYAAPQTGSNAGSIHPHAPSEIGHYSFQYDSNGNQLERRYRDDENTRQIVWDENNRMGCVHEFEHEHPNQVIAQIPVNCSSTAEKLNHDDRNILNGSHTPEVRFVYNDRGERVFKESDENVSFYLNPHYTEKSDDAYKHILIGTTRLVTKEVNTEKTKELEHEQYYYHPDHLGSSSFVTDREGKLEEHLEYFPFGETWIEEESSLPIAFRFTAKELDGETGLYYFGARYYDPRTSVWQSADPILGKYLEGKGGMGGVFNPSNFGMYSYSHLNPINFIDPDGNATGINIALDGNNYYLVAQSRSEICGGSRSCQADAAALPEAHLDMHPMEVNGETQYLSPTWGDNKTYMDKEAELALGAMSDQTGDVAKATKNPLPAALSVALKAAEVAVSDDKAKTLVGALGQEAGSKYGKALAKDGMYKEPGRIAGPAAEIAGDKLGGNALSTAMERRNGSAHNNLKATEAQRQQVQQQHLKLLNNNTEK
jgi:RHS repeat-associated protein